MSGAVPLNTKINLYNAALLAFDEYTPQPGDSAVLQLTVDHAFYNPLLTVYQPNVHPTLPIIDAVSNSTVVRNITSNDYKISPNLTTANGIVTATWGGKQLAAIAQTFKLPPAQEYFMTVVVRLGQDWPNQGGKLPGLADTGMATNTGGQKLNINGVDCNNAGWGGRAANGCRWSARTGWGGRTGDLVGLHTYFYAQKPYISWGYVQPWPTPVHVGKWFAYVERVKVNTPGQADGRLSYWLCDQVGCKAQFDRGDIVFRSTGLAQSLVSEAWVDVFCGGASCGPAPFPTATVNLKRMTVTVGLPDMGALASEVQALNNSAT